MSDYYIHNSSSFLPRFKPGVNGYGQRGSSGNTGAVGGSIYYSAIEVENNQSVVLELVRRNKMLSDNLYEDCYGTYKDGDLIMDCVGNIYTLSIKDGVYGISPADGGSSSIHSSATILFTNLSVACTTSMNKRGEHKWKQENPYCVLIHDNNTGKDSFQKLPEAMYRERCRPESFGNYVSFSLTGSDELEPDKYMMKYVLALPNGQVFETTPAVGTMEASLFIDNRYLYGCFDTKNGCDFAHMTQSEEDSIIGEGVTYVIEGNMYDVVRYAGATDASAIANGWAYDKSSNHEHDKDVTLMCSYFIKANCQAFAEITNMENGKTYRMYVDDIVLDNNNGIIPEDEHNYFVDKADPTFVWHRQNTVPGKWISKNLVDGKVVTTTNRADAFRPFDQYVFFDEFITNADSEDEQEIRFYYTWKNGLQNLLADGDFLYMASDAGLDSEDITETEGYWNLQGGRNSNRTYRLYFKNVSDISLTVQFDKIMPTCLFYVGVPDCALVQLGESDGTLGTFDDIEPGIYYSTKFTPPSVYDDDAEGRDIAADAGLTVINIHLSDYNVDPRKFHFIDLGIVDYGTNHSENMDDYHKFGIHHVKDAETGVISYNTSVYDFAESSLNEDGYTNVYTSMETSGEDFRNYGEHYTPPTSYDVRLFIRSSQTASMEEISEEGYYPPTHELTKIDNPATIISA